MNNEEENQQTEAPAENAEEVAKIEQTEHAPIVEEPAVEENKPAFPDVENTPKTASEHVEAMSDDEVFEHIKQQVAERGDAIVPPGATSLQYVVQLIRYVQSVGKLDNGASPESERLTALETKFATWESRLADHGIKPLPTE